MIRIPRRTLRRTFWECRATHTGWCGPPSDAHMRRSYRCPSLGKIRRNRTDCSPDTHPPMCVYACQYVQSQGGRDCGHCNVRNESWDDTNISFYPNACVWAHGSIDIGSIAIYVQTKSIPRMYDKQIELWVQVSMCINMYSFLDMHSRARVMQPQKNTLHTRMPIPSSPGATLTL